MKLENWTQRKKHHTPIVMTTCYDYTFAQILAATEVDALLVGDSCAMVMHGYPNTLHATIEMMEFHTQAVVRGAGDKFIVTDLPFLSFRQGKNALVRMADRLFKAGTHALKIEGCDGNLQHIAHLVESGVPVMGHLGLTPQFFYALGGFKKQGKTEQQQAKILNDAKRLEAAGCFALVLECVPSELAEQVSKALSIPVIGIGAGEHTDGQILVLQDLLGLTQGSVPGFVTPYENLGLKSQHAITAFCKQVKMHSGAHNSVLVEEI